MPVLRTPGQRCSLGVQFVGFVELVELAAHASHPKPDRDRVSRTHPVAANPEERLQDVERLPELQSVLEMLRVSE